MRKSTLYVSMLALGLALELVLLESGKGIEAPPALGGEWQMQSDGGDCAELHSLAMTRSLVMNIDQTGPGLEIAIPGIPRLNGSIDRNRIVAAARGTPVQLSAATAGRSLRGRIQCARGAASFTAERRHE